MEHVQQQQNVWSLIKERVPEAEVPEIRSIIGHELIDMYKEIYSQVQLLEEIWHDVHEGKFQMPHSSLADPPAVKELLRSELQVLLLSLRQQAATLGRDVDEVMFRYNPRVVSYVLGIDRQRSPDSTECTPPTSRPESSRSSSRLSSLSSIEDEIEGLRHKLNIIRVNEVVSRIQSILIEECEVLKNDVQMLQESVPLEYLKQSSSMEPTLIELQKERHLIQQDLDDLNMMNECTCTETLKYDGAQFPSREMKLTRLADDSQNKQCVSPVSTRTDFLQPKPPPAVVLHENRPALLVKTRHRLYLKSTQHPGSSPDPPQQIQKVDLENSDIHPVRQVSCASSATVQSSPSESETAGVETATSMFKDGALAGNFQAASRPLIPTPPAGHRSSSRGQRKGR